MTDQLDAIIKHDEDEGAKNTPVDTKAELLKHLSKEVELATVQMITQRSRNNLVIAVGPYVVIGALATNESVLKGLHATPEVVFFAISILFVLVYLALGYAAALIELKFWDRADVMRREIAELTSRRCESLAFSAFGLKRSYMFVFGTTAVIFGLVMFILRTLGGA